jgi:hypothetical protein
MACSREVGPCELPRIHLVTGAVCVVEMAPGTASLLSVRFLADAVTCDSPMVHGLGAVLWRCAGRRRRACYRSDARG